ncbi:hypothetical protein LguiA_021858 [Lonicera macranthoides]
MGGNRRPSFESRGATRCSAIIGIDFLSKTMYLEDRTVRLQLWVVDKISIRLLDNLKRAFYQSIKSGSTILRVIMVKLLMQRIRRRVPFSRKLRIITAPRRLSSPSSFVYTEGAEGICTESFDKKTRTTPQRLASPSSFVHIEGAEGTSTERIDKKTRTAL